MPEDNLVDASQPSRSTIVDGRRERAVKTRQAIIFAVISLLEEGIADAPASEIALRAGLSLRTIFMHFPTQEALTLAIMDELDKRHLQKVATRTPDGLFGARFEEFIERRAALLERLITYSRSAAALSQSSAIVARRRKIRRRLRREIEVTFASELAILGKANGAAILNAAAALCESDAWNNLRRNYDLSITNAKTVLRVSLKKLFS